MGESQNLGDRRQAHEVQKHAVAANHRQEVKDVGADRARVRGAGAAVRLCREHGDGAGEVAGRHGQVGDSGSVSGDQEADQQRAEEAADA